MCNECHHSPCHPRCPNAPEPPPVHVCAYCDESVLVGDEFVEIDGSYYHLDCVSDMGTKELLKLFEVAVSTAEMEQEEI